MSYSILRVERVKGSGNTKGLQKHNQRENNNYNNKDIRHEDTNKNYDLINGKNVDYNKLISDKIDENYTGNRKIRADAIRHVEGIITSDENFFNGLSEEETHEFFKDSLDFAKIEYGEENLIYAIVHLDEKVPHMHFGFVPLTTDGRLSAKEKLGNKKAMTELQDRFNQFVNLKGYNLERGTAKQVSEREHRDIDKFKKDTEFHKQELKNVQHDLQKLNKQLSVDIEAVRATSDFEYENEVEVKKGLFAGREERETGRKIVSAEEFMRLRDTISSAERIIDDYEELKNQDMYKENEKLKKEKQFEKNKASEWMDRWFHHEKRIDELEKDNGQLKKDLNLAEEFQNSAVYLYSHTRRIFPGFEKGYNKVKEKMLNNDTTEHVGRFMEITQEHVYSLDKKQQRRRTNDLEM